MKIKNFKRTFLGDNHRTILLRKNIIANFIIKGISGFFMVLLVPITLKCLGIYANGVWQTISAALILIDNMDIGLGNGLRNRLTEYAAKNEWTKARMAVSTTLCLLIIIIVPIMFLLLAIVNNINMYSLLNIDYRIVQNLPQTISVAIVLFCMTFIMKFLGNIYLGMQLPAISNFLAMAGQPIILASTYIMYLHNINSLFWIAVINLSAPLFVYCIAFPYTFHIKYPQLKPSFKYLSKKMSYGLFSMGILFFLNQISSTIVLLSSNMIISRWFAPSMVTPYQIAYRYFSIPLIIFTVINAPMWSATADAYQKHDIEWIKNSNKRMNKTLLFFLSVIIFMILISNYMYHIWIGKDITIDFGITASVGLYIYIMMLSLVYCYYLNGIGVLQLQLICTLFGVLIFFISSNILFHCIGNILSITLSMSLSLLPNIFCNKIQFIKIINGTAKGIWKR